jgi:hypothetical protein
LLSQDAEREVGPSRIKANHSKLSHPLETTTVAEFRGQEF